MISAVILILFYDFVRFPNILSSVHNYYLKLSLDSTTNKGFGRLKCKITNKNTIIATFRLPDKLMFIFYSIVIVIAAAKTAAR